MTFTWANLIVKYYISYQWNNIFLSLQDPTNGYYNVRATTHDEVRTSTRSLLYQEFRPLNPASVSATAGGPVANIHPAPTGRYEPRPASRMAHNTYTHFNTIARASQIQAPPNPVSKTTDYSGERGLLESTNPLAFDSYAYSTTPQYRLGFAPPLEAGPAYEMYPTGQGVGTSQDANTGKYPSSAQFPYSTPPTEYSQRHTQRMQTHVWNKHTCQQKSTSMDDNIWYTLNFTYSYSLKLSFQHNFMQTHTHIAFSTFTTIWLREKSAKLINDCSRRGNHKRSERKHVNLIIFPSSVQFWRRWVDVVKQIL